jgi:hypothetical protein
VPALGALDRLSLAAHQIIDFIYYRGSDFATVGVVAALDSHINGEFADYHPSASLHDSLVGAGGHDGSILRKVRRLKRSTCGIYNGTQRQVCPEQQQKRVPLRTATRMTIVVHQIV